MKTIRSDMDAASFLSHDITTEMRAGLEKMQSLLPEGTHLELSARLRSVGGHACYFAGQIVTNAGDAVAECYEAGLSIPEVVDNLSKQLQDQTGLAATRAALEKQIAELQAKLNALPVVNPEPITQHENENPA